MNAMTAWQVHPMTFDTLGESKFFCVKTYCLHTGACVGRSNDHYIVRYWDK